MNENNFKAGVRLDLPFMLKIDGKCLWQSFIIKLQKIYCLFESIKVQKRCRFFYFDPFVN